MTAAKACWCGLPWSQEVAPGAYRAGVSVCPRHRVPQGAFARLKLHARKRARAVSRGGGGGNTISLPDVRHEVVGVAVMRSSD
jgi:hypothetical protein